MASILNTAYIKENFGKSVQSGINYYPYEISFEHLMTRIMTVFAQLLPACLIMGMPVFLVTIVNEKEKRLIENMKTNGMKMSYFWTATYISFYMFYTAINLVFFFVGKFIFQTGFMVTTDSGIILTILNGWTMAQISYAFFLSVFFDRSQVASIVGYILSVYQTCTGMVMTFIAFDPLVTSMPWYFHFFPWNTFIRAYVNMLRPCAAGLDHCYQNFSDVPRMEFHVSVFLLYFHAVFWAFVAWYLN